jgi:hypothetical protein
MAVEARVHSRLVDRRRRLSGTRENLGDYWSVHYWMCGVDSELKNTTKLINRLHTNAEAGFVFPPRYAILFTSPSHLYITRSFPAAPLLLVRDV